MSLPTAVSRLQSPPRWRSQSPNVAPGALRNTPTGGMGMPMQLPSPRPAQQQHGFATPQGMGMPLCSSGAPGGAGYLQTARGPQLGSSSGAFAPRVYGSDRSLSPAPCGVALAASSALPAGNPTLNRGSQMRRIISSMEALHRTPTFGQGPAQSDQSSGGFSGRSPVGNNHPSRLASEPRNVCSVQLASEPTNISSGPQWPRTVPIGTAGKINDGSSRVLLASPRAPVASTCQRDLLASSRRTGIVASTPQMESLALSRMTGCVASTPQIQFPGSFHKLGAVASTPQMELIDSSHKLGAVVSTPRLERMGSSPPVTMNGAVSLASTPLDGKKGSSPQSAGFATCARQYSSPVGFVGADEEIQLTEGRPAQIPLERIPLVQAEVLKRNPHSAFLMHFNDQNSLSSTNLEQIYHRQRSPSPKCDRARIHQRSHSPVNAVICRSSSPPLVDYQQPRSGSRSRSVTPPRQGVAPLSTAKMSLSPGSPRSAYSSQETHACIHTMVCLKPDATGSMRLGGPNSGPAKSNLLRYPDDSKRMVSHPIQVNLPKVVQCSPARKAATLLHDQGRLTHSQVHFAAGDANTPGIYARVRTLDKCCGTEDLDYAPSSYGSDSPATVHSAVSFRNDDWDSQIIGVTSQDLLESSTMTKRSNVLIQEEVVCGASLVCALPESDEPFQAETPSAQDGDSTKTDCTDPDSRDPYTEPQIEQDHDLGAERWRCDTESSIIEESEHCRILKVSMTSQFDESKPIVETIGQEQQPHTRSGNSSVALRSKIGDSNIEVPRLSSQDSIPSETVKNSRSQDNEKAYQPKKDSRTSEVAAQKQRPRSKSIVVKFDLSDLARLSQDSPGSEDPEMVSSGVSRRVSRSKNEKSDGGSSMKVPILQAAHAYRAHRCPSVLEVEVIDKIMQLGLEANDEEESKLVAENTALNGKRTIDEAGEKQIPRTKGKAKPKARPDRSPSPNSKQKAKQPAVQRKLSVAIKSSASGNTPTEGDVKNAARLFHDSVPRKLCKIKSIERVANADLYACFRSFAAAEGGNTEVVFYAPSDLSGSRLNRLQEMGLTEEDFEETDSLGYGVPVALHAGVAYRRAQRLQKPQKGQPRCICMLLCCPGKLGGVETATVTDCVPSPTEYCITEPGRLYLAYVIHYQVNEWTEEYAEELAQNIRKAELDATERHRAAKVKWREYSLNCDGIVAAAFERLRNATAQNSFHMSEGHGKNARKTQIVHLDVKMQEAQDVINLYLLGSGRDQESSEASSLLSRLQVQRVENYELFMAYCAQGQGDSASPRGSRENSPSPSPTNRGSPRAKDHSRERSSSPRSASPRASPRSQDRHAQRFREQVVWHGTRLKRDDEENLSLADKVRSIAQQGFDPERCVKGAGPHGGIWAATAPLASFGRGLDGRFAFVLCVAKTTFNDWVDTSCVRVQSRERVLPLYVILHS